MAILLPVDEGEEGEDERDGDDGSDQEPPELLPLAGAHDQVAATDENISEDDDAHRDQAVQEGEEESNSGEDAAEDGPLLDLESAEQDDEDMQKTEETVDNDEEVDNSSFTFVEQHVDDRHIDTNNGNAETYTNNNVDIGEVKYCKLWPNAMVKAE